MSIRDEPFAFEPIGPPALTGRELLVLSHRGSHHHFRENTMDAFADAVAQGVDGIETDVRVTADHKLVLYHDRLLGQQEVSQISQAELAARLPFPIPLADEALSAWDTLWNLEIKTPLALEATVALVRRYQAKRRILVTSFWHNVIEEVSRTCDVECGLLVSHRPFGKINFKWFTCRGIRTVVWNHEFVDAEMLARARRHSMCNLSYKIETAAEHQAARELGLDGVITDHPEYLLGTPPSLCA